MKFIRYITMFILVVALSGCGGAVQPTAPTEAAVPAGQFYFSSSTCEHCAAVRQYISDSKIKDRLFFVEQEVDTNSSAAALLRAIGVRCGLASAELAVPFFWDGNQCYVGQEAVVSYFDSIR